MCNKKKSIARTFPVFIVGSILIISGFLKIAAIHPMLSHFKEMGFGRAGIALLGSAEMIFSILFLIVSTSRFGLLLLTGYLGGAMAMEISFGQVIAPMVFLVLLWLAAFLREPSAFLPISFYKNSAHLKKIPS